MAAKAVRVAAARARSHRLFKISSLIDRQATAAGQRQACFNVEVERGDWKEHHEASTKFVGYKRSSEIDHVPLLWLVGWRINASEEKLGILLSQSVTKGTMVERTAKPTWKSAANEEDDEDDEDDDDNDDNDEEDNK